MTEEQKALLAELDEILEKRQAPFNSSGKRGNVHAIGGADLPHHTSTSRGNLGADGWECHCANYHCQCKGKGKRAGQKKSFTVKKDYKKSYNNAYVSKYGAWKDTGRSRAQPSAVKRAKVG